MAFSAENTLAPITHINIGCHTKIPYFLKCYNNFILLWSPLWNEVMGYYRLEIVIHPF